jgi:biotin carboxylase
MRSRILIIEPGEQATRGFFLQGLSKLCDVELIVASGVYPSAKGQWFEPLVSSFIPFKYYQLDELAQEAAKHQISGVLTFFDLCVETANHVAQNLNLPLVYQGSLNPTRKDFQRRLLEEKRLSSVRYAVIESDATDFREMTHKFGFPCIVKPVQFTSSLGVKICRDLSEVEVAVKKGRVCDFWDEKVRELISNVSNKMLIEDMLMGEEISVEGYCFNGEYQIIGITQKLRSDSVRLDELGHVFPHPLIPTDSVLGLRIHNYLSEVHQQFGIKNSLTHAELFLGKSGNEPTLVELNCRPGGGCIPVLVEQALEMNFSKLAADLSLGRRPTPISHKAVKTMSVQFVYTTQEGRLIEPPVSEPSNFNDTAELTETMKTPGSLLFRAGLNEVTRCALVITNGAKQALPEMDRAKVNAFLKVSYLEDRWVGFLWATAADLEPLFQVEKATWGNTGASRECIKQRLSLYQYSTIMAIDIQSDRCLGFLTQIPVSAPIIFRSNSWNSLAALATDESHFRLVGQQKELQSFGISVACLVNAPKGLATELFREISARLDLIGCKSFVGGIRMIGLRKHIVDGGTIESYVQGIYEGKIYNPVYGAVYRAGGNAIEPIENYYNDNESLNYGLKIEILPNSNARANS